ncbi:MAG: spermidine synthase, partial [Pseudomonadota bacterium]
SLGWRVLGLNLAAILVTGAGFASTGKLTGFLETRLFEGEIIWAETTPYQRLVVTDRNGATQLFLNGNLQFDSRDEHRYHETLVHPAMIMAPRHDHVLILGGGDGLAAREVLRYDGVGEITLVDLDPAMTTLFRGNPQLRSLNQGSLDDLRLTVVNQDAWKFLEATDQLFDVVIIDLPDPQNFAISKLYSLGLYKELAGHLTADSVIVTQATSPLFAREAFWSIHNTLAATSNPYAPDTTLETSPYHAYVPSFGDWGFVMAGSRLAAKPYHSLPEGLKFLTEAGLAAMTEFPPDMAPTPSAVNTILDHPLIAYYEDGWSRWFR